MGNKPGVRAGQGRMGRWLLVVWGLMALVLSGTPAMAAGPQVTAVVAGGNSTYAWVHPKFVACLISSEKF